VRRLAEGDLNLVVIKTLPVPREGRADKGARLIYLF
jgi:hypothetical protein